MKMRNLIESDMLVSVDKRKDKLLERERITRSFITLQDKLVNNVSIEERVCGV